MTDQPIRAILPVLRFSLKGGFGFLDAPVGDVLIHARQLPKNLGVVLPGWECDVEYEKTAKGFRVMKVFKILPKDIIVVAEKDDTP